MSHPTNETSRAAGCGCGLCRQMAAVLYKNYLYRKGGVILLIFEFSLPALFTGGLLALSILFGKDVVYALPLFITVGLFLSIVSSVGGMVSERETGFKELLKIMGLTNWIQWIGWLMNSLIVSIPSMMIMGVMTAIGFLDGCDKSLIVSLFICFPIQSITFAYFLSSFFTKHTQALGIIGMLWFVLYIAQLFIINNVWEPLSLTEKLPSILIPHMAFGHTIYILADLTFSSAKANDSTQHVTWLNMFQPHDLIQPTIPIEKQPTPLTLGLTLVTMLGSSILYILLAIYIDNILPREFGVRKPFYYPFMPRNWCSLLKVCGRRPKNRKMYMTSFYETSKSVEEKSELTFEQNIKFDTNDLVTLIGDPWDNEALNFEPHPIDRSVGVEVFNLKKFFGPQKKIALDGLTLNIFEGEITALLGRNGTGKTTLIRILTGMTAPSSGTAFVNGHDVEVEMDDVRQDLGYCPQENMLFDRLTVKNHLDFSGRLKGQTGKELQVATQSLLNQLKLTEKRDVLIKNLSGGQKRKVQLGMSLMGEAKVIFLDEPTSGMDPESHRLIWNLLLQVRADKTILLITQSMEEAEVLGDRIAILSAGKIKCSGSALFLKKLYGSGYTLHATRKREKNFSFYQENGQSASNLNNQSLMTWQSISTSSSPAQKFLDLVQKHIEQASWVNDDDKVDTKIEIKIKLPDLENLTSKFPPLFTDLYDQMESLQIQHFGLTYTTISDVFAKFGELEDQKNGNGEGLGVDNYGDFVENPIKHLTGCALARRQFYGLLVKRCQCGLKKWTVLLVQIILSVGLTIGGLFMFNDLYENKVYRDIPEFFAAIIFLAISFLSASFILMPLEERLCKAKQLQLMTGVNMGSYWLSFFLWDFFLIVIIASLMAICIPCIDKYEILIKSDGPAIFILILIIYEISAISFSYAFSLVARTVAGGFAATLSFHLIFGLVLGFLFSILEREEDVRPHVREMSTFLNIFPPFAALKCLAKFTSVLTRNGQGCVLNEGQFSICETTDEFKDSSEIDSSLREILECCPNCNEMSHLKVICHQNLTLLSSSLSDRTNSPEYERGVLQLILYQIVSTIFLFTVLFLVEFGGVRWLRKKMRKLTNGVKQSQEKLLVDDLDIQEETRRIDEMVKDDDRMYEEGGILVHKLWKKFGNYFAVKNLTFRVPRGSCFGLLGVNGAGKTTLFRMLTGDTVPTQGDAYLGGAGIGVKNKKIFSLEKNRQKFLSNIGYCPQFDGIIGILTGTQMLQLFCRLRGLIVTAESLEAEVQGWLVKMGLDENGHAECRKYSGGMKRRLSTAMALIGQPAVVLLDEPSCGVDPQGQKLIWKLLQNSTKQGQTIILTSHSMEECEACCSNLSIMVDGQFQCWGSLRHLKNKFSQGYTLTLKLKPMEISEEVERHETVQNIIKKYFEPCTLVDGNHNVMQFQLVNTELKWNDIFFKMESIMKKDRPELGDESNENGQNGPTMIDDYVVTETGLEQIFLQFAKKHVEDSSQDVNKCCFFCRKK